MGDVYRTRRSTHVLVLLAARQAKQIADPLGAAPVYFERVHATTGEEDEGSMQTVTRTLAVGVVIVVAAVASACRRDRPDHVARVPAAAEIEWREIGTWSGRVSRQTESFEVSTAAMRLRWQTTNETSHGGGRLTVTLHSAVSGRPLQTIVDAHGASSATVNVADEPRWCHFVIEAQNLEYRMTLEQGYASDRR